MRKYGILEIHAENRVIQLSEGSKRVKLIRKTNLIALIFIAMRNTLMAILKKKMV